VTDVDETTRAAPPTVAQVGLVIQEDERGRFIMHDGRRIPVRNGASIGNPLEDWQNAREIEQAIESGDGVDAEAIGWRNFFGAVVRMSTAAGGWTTYTVVAEMHSVLWAASLPVIWAPTAVAVALAAHWAVLPWSVAFVAWTLLMSQFGESDRTIAR
jgi:hypothetical protein